MPIPGYACSYTMYGSSHHQGTSWFAVHQQGSLSLSRFNHCLITYNLINMTSLHWPWACKLPYSSPSSLVAGRRLSEAWPYWKKVQRTLCLQGVFFVLAGVCCSHRLTRDCHLIGPQRKTEIVSFLMRVACILGCFFLVGYVPCR